MLTIINSGHRKINLEGYAWLVKPPFKDGMQLVTWITPNDFTAASSALPITLDEGCKATYLNDLNIFETAPEVFNNQSAFFAWWRIRSLKINVSTTRDNYVIDVPSAIKNLIWSQYKRRNA